MKGNTLPQRPLIFYMEKENIQFQPILAIPSQPKGVENNLRNSLKVHDPEK